MILSEALATAHPVIAMPADPEEARQIGRARNNDPSAIDWLLARYRARVIRLATHILRRPDEAEDAAQEAFVRAFRNLDSFRDEGAFYTWLYRIVVRVCLDRRSSASRRRESSMGDQALNEAAHDPSIGDLETRIVVERLMARLSPSLRAALVLRELEGLEYGEIARVLGIPIGLVRWRLHTARKQFQELWLESEAASG
jgi:RNA polymerase sigma-70 factor (ECF subfamily)